MNRLETMMAILMAPLQRLENAMIQVRDGYDVDTAVGVQLDVLGRKVGQSRLGLSDDDYRRYIRARIATNRSTGKTEELNNIVDLILNDSTQSWVAKREGTATAVITITNAITASIATALITFLRSAVGNGIRMILRYSLSPPAQTFTFDIGPGFDQGHFAGDLE